MLRNPAGERNVSPIIETLKKYIYGNQERKNLLEISSGVGLHAQHLSKTFPNLNIQPSEFDARMFESIKEYTKFCENVYEPIKIDISQNMENWMEKTNGRLLSDCQGYFDFILNINMIHITPFICTEMLFKNSSKLLKSNGFLFTYGPYSVNHVISPESNVRFNQMLKSENPSWGIRDISDVENIANANSITLENIHDLPANNKILIWRKN